jgi:hypothetical protein
MALFNRVKEFNAVGSFTKPHYDIGLVELYAERVHAENWTNPEECRLLGCCTVWVYYKPTFRRNMSPSYNQRFQCLRTIVSAFSVSEI